MGATTDDRFVGLRELIRDVPDFPYAGIVFRDLTPLLADAPALAATVSGLAGPFEASGITRVVGIEARGFIMAAPVAVALGAGFVPVRKKGKLPWHTEHAAYSLEYGEDSLEIHCDALSAGDRVLIIDDVIATGGTAAATVDLVRRLGGTVVGMGFLVELLSLGGRGHLVGSTGIRSEDVVALVSYA